MKKNNFWSKKPVGINKKPSIITTNLLPYLNLPNLTDFKFKELVSLEEIIELLQSEYISDKENKISLFYTREFFIWYFSNPNILPCDYITLYSNTQLIGFCHSRKITIQLDNLVYDCLTINFLCIKKEFRNRNLAAYFIEEMNRRSINRNIKIALFTGVKLLPFKFTSAIYYHKPINMVNLLECNFISKKTFFSNPFFFELKKPKKEFKLANENDLLGIYDLYNPNQLIHEKIDFNTFKYYFTPFKDTNYIFIVLENNKYSEFINVYTIYTKYNGRLIKGAYIYYWYSNDPINLFNDLSYYLKELNYDMLSFLDLGSNCVFRKCSGVMKGSAEINYYFYNYQCNEVSKEDVFLLMH